MTASNKPSGDHSSYQDLLVWQKAMDLVDTVYTLSERFPPMENYGLRTQITRAAVSVTLNIAEGQARTTAKDFANFLAVARGSLMETETLILIAGRRGYIPAGDSSVALGQVKEISKMLSGLRRSIRTDNRRRTE